MSRFLLLELGLTHGVCAQDTLLTCLVVDKMVQEQEGSKRQTPKNQRLASIGVGNGLVSCFGGLPGAQATIRSVLILKEGGTMSLAGGAAGVFVMIEMLIFKELVKLIPKAVFSGILLKVGYEVFDFTPFSVYLKKAIEAHLDSRRSVEALKRRHLKASTDLQAYDSHANELDVQGDDGGSMAFVPTKSKQHARAKVHRYADALRARGEEVKDWSEVEESDEANRDKERLQSGGRKSGMKALQQAMRKSGKGTFSTLVDTSQPLPMVDNLEMFFIVGARSQFCLTCIPWQN